MSRLTELQQIISQDTNDCILWHGAINPQGYGTLEIAHAGKVAHRVAWSLAHGRPIPEGLEIDHLCFVTACVNPKHLEAVTPRENTLRAQRHYGVKSGATACIKGHPFTDENTYYNPRGHRTCKPCRRERDRARSGRKKKAKVNS